MRIALDIRHIRDFGIGTHIRNVLRKLVEIDHENEYLLVARTPDPGDLPPLPENFRVAVYNHSDEEPVEDLRFPAFLRGLRADVHHIPLNVVPYFMPRPYVVTIHDMASLRFPRASGFRQTWKSHRFRRGLARAARVVAVSESTKGDVTELLGIPPWRIEVVYNAPDPVFLQNSIAHDLQAKALLAERYQITYPYLLYAGSVRAQKNIPRLIEAFAVLRGELDQHPIYRDLRLVIIGDEISRYPEVRRAAIQSRVQSQVRFLGFVPIEVLRSFYKQAIAFVFPSLYEGFGLPPLEAMACGTPVVTSNVSSLPEVVGDAAIIVNPENVFDIARGIREILLDEFLRRRCVRLGMLQLRRFSWHTSAQQVRHVYAAAAESR
jgi:glycosyltransferase involved in cell wall biosynthesis